jgi:hypothetical protein
MYGTGALASVISHLLLRLAQIRNINQGSLIYRNARPNHWLLDVASVRGVQRR